MKSGIFYLRQFRSGLLDQNEIRAIEDNMENYSDIEDEANILDIRSGRSKDDSDEKSVISVVGR